MDLLAEREADANFVSSRLLEKIEDAQLQTAAAVSDAPQVYRGAKQNSRLMCQDSIEANAAFQYKYRTTLLLQKPTLRIVEEDI